MTATETILLDATSENLANAELDFNAGAFSLEEMSFPTPPLDTRYAEPADADGDRLVASRYRNREITLTTGLVAATDDDLAAAAAQLAAKVAKINRSGGTLTRRMPTGRDITFDVLEASLDPATDIAYSSGRYLRCALKFVCRPFGRGRERPYPLHTEATLPVLVFTETVAPEGDVPALGRLVVTDAQAVAQQWLVAGLQVANFNTADPATEKLYFEAEGRTLLSTSAIVTQAGAAGGASNNAIRYTLSASYVQFLSTRTTGAGAHLKHTGSYRVFARTLISGAGSATVALDWATGDLSTFTRNATHTLAASANWSDVDLGIVQLTAPVTGPAQWEGRIVGKTSSSNTVTVDCIWLVPVDEWAGEASGTSTAPVMWASHSVEIRYDAVVRQDTTGTYYTAVAYEGDLLTVPPAGAEGRGLRAIVKAGRGSPTAGDTAIDDITARLYVTPRFLEVPS